MHFIDYGLSAFRRSTIESLVPSGEKRDLAEVFYRLSLAGELAGFESKPRFYEIGSPAGLEDCEGFIQDSLEGYVRRDSNTTNR